QQRVPASGPRQLTARVPAGAGAHNLPFAQEPQLASREASFRQDANRDAPELSMMAAGSPTGRFDARCFCTVLDCAPGGGSRRAEGNLAHAIAEQNAPANPVSRRENG